MGVKGLHISPLLALVAGLIALALPAVATSSSSHEQVVLSSLESGVLQQLNQVRADHSLAPLTLSTPLTIAAKQHSTEMAEDGYFQHSSFDGTAFWKRIGRLYSDSSFQYWAVGENLLWSSPDVSAGRALDMWMNSPVHRANILATNWREIGISAVHVAAAPGAFNGRPVTVITTDFGVRR